MTWATWKRKHLTGGLLIILDRSPPVTIKAGRQDSREVAECLHLIHRHEAEREQGNWEMTWVFKTVTPPP